MEKLFSEFDSDSSILSQNGLKYSSDMLSEHYLSESSSKNIESIITTSASNTNENNYSDNNDYYENFYD